MSEAAKYIVVRKETSGYSTRGPIANAFTLQEAARIGEEMAHQFPDQDFVILGEVAQLRRISAIIIQPSRDTLPDSAPATLKAVTP